LRKADKDYQNAVRSFSPDKTILLLGNRLIRKIREICEMVLNPLWGRIDKVLSFLPSDARSVQSRNHYRNHMRWISGVHSRIEHFLDEMHDKDLTERFDVATELEDYTRNVLYGYVVEKGRARIELRLDRLDHAVVEGNRYRFRRMFFNLVMNAVDALAQRKIGHINVSTEVDGDRVVLRVGDSGRGMPAEKIAQLLAPRASLDGELHSLGFVFVRQTVRDFGGELSIESTEGEGTTISVQLPHLADAEPTPHASSEWAEYDVLRSVDRVPPRGRDRTEGPAPSPRTPAPRKPAPRPQPVGDSPQEHAGGLVWNDFHACEAEHPGCIFAMAVTEEDRVEFFTHRPYERFYNINHEDLSPMFFEATIRGRLEEDDDKEPVLILKSPQNVRDYFEFKEVPEARRSAELYERMVRDEYVRIGRTLAATGLPPETRVLLSDLARFFGDSPELIAAEPFALALLAEQPVSTPADA
jgi:two-component sensor histidine kinase